MESKIKDELLNAAEDVVNIAINPRHDYNTNIVDLANEIADMFVKLGDGKQLEAKKHFEKFFKGSFLHFKNNEDLLNLGEEFINLSINPTHCHYEPLLEVLYLIGESLVGLGHGNKDAHTYLLMDVASRVSRM